jgi:hypothetical protein
VAITVSAHRRDRRGRPRPVRVIAAGAALVVLTGCSLGGDARPVVRADGHSHRVVTVQQYASLVRDHERGVRASAAAMDDACPFISAGNQAGDLSANACLTHLQGLGDQARRLALSLEQAVTGSDTASSGSPPDKIAGLVEMTRSAASAYAQNVEALGREEECLTTVGPKCEQLRLAVASARSELMAQFDAWARLDTRRPGTDQARESRASGVSAGRG